MIGKGLMCVCVCVGFVVVVFIPLNALRMFAFEFKDFHFVVPKLTEHAYNIGEVLIGSHSAKWIN